MTTSQFESDDEFVGAATEAALEGDQVVEVSSVRAVLAIREFRTLWLSTLGSLVGTWMQNVTLAAFVYATTGDTVLTSLVAFCNLAPQLLFPTIGGVLADLFDRRRLLFWLSLEQLAGSAALAWIVHSPHYSRPALFACVIAVGIGAAIESPLLLAVTPSLVPKEQLHGAVSLSSVSLNISRVIGPAIGAAIYATAGAWWVFALNAATYLIVIVGITRVHFPTIERRHGEPLRERLFGGVRHVRNDPVVARAMATVALFAMFCGSYMVQFPAIAQADWGVSSNSAVYGLMHATFGVGAIVGSLSIGTFLAGHQIEKVLRLSLIGFGIVLAVFITVDSPWLAFPIGFVQGFFHFTVVTSVSAIFQARLTHSIRGRVSGLWVMCLIGPVPVGGMFAGWLISHSTVNTIIYSNCVIALLLAWYADLRTRNLHPVSS